MNIVEFKVLDQRLIDNPDFLPTRATEQSAGLDLRACINEPLILEPGGEALISCGFAMHIDDRHVAAILLPKSGLGAKCGIVLGNLVGLVDSDYQGPVKASVWNRSRWAYTIKPMEYICQMAFVPVAFPTMCVVDEFRLVTDRGEGGFGSSGRGV